MTMQAEIDAYHEEIRDIWGLEGARAIPGFSLMPHLGQLPLPGPGVDVLFFGMNPSFVEISLARHWQQVRQDLGMPDAILALDWDGPHTDSEWSERRATLVELDRHSRANYSRYYGLFGEVAEDARAGASWQHLDAFPLRLTSQRTLTPLLPISEESEPEWVVLKQVLCATLRLARAMEPEVIVVANSYLSKVLEQHLSLRRQAIGHRYDADLFPGIPFLLTSQLSGGATSKYGRERLVADLRDALAGAQGLS